MWFALYGNGKLQPKEGPTGILEFWKFTEAPWLEKQPIYCRGSELKGPSRRSIIAQVFWQLASLVGGS